MGSMYSKWIESNLYVVVMIHGSTFTIHLIFKWSNDEGTLPTNNYPLKSLSSR